MENTKDGTFNIEINQLISGVSKEYIFEVSIPPISSSIGDHERNAVWVEASLSARQVGDDSKPPIKLSAELIYTVFNETEEIPPDSEIDEDVLFNVLRVRGAEVIETCMQNAEKRDYDRGQ